MSRRTSHRLIRRHYASRLSCYALVACLLLLAACTPPHSSTTQPASGSGCAPAGSTRVPTTHASIPATQGAWPMFRGDLNRDGAAAEGSGAGLLTPAWSYCTGGPVFSSPIVQAGIVYIASTAKTLTALDMRTGTVVWRFQGTSPFYSTPTLQAGVLYAAAVDGLLYAFDAATGRTLWQSKLATPDAKLWSSPAVADGLVLIGLASPLNEHPKIAGQLEAFDIHTGTLRWRAWTLGNDTPGGGIWSSPAVDLVHSVVYVATGDPDDGVQAFALSSGRLLWHWRSVVRDISDTDIGAGPVLYSDQQGKTRVAVGGKDGFLVSLDAQSGQVIWRSQIGNQIYSSPAFAQGTLYAVGTLIRHAVEVLVNAQTGMPGWHYPIPAIVYASPTLAGQTLYLTIGDAFGPGDGGIEVLNAQNGQRVQFVDLHSTSSSSPAVLANWLFVGAQNGNLYTFTRT